MAADKQADDFRSRRAGGDRSVAATPGKLPGKLPGKFIAHSWKK